MAALRESVEAGGGVEGHHGLPWAVVSFGTGWFEMASGKEVLLFLAPSWGEVMRKPSTSPWELSWEWAPE